MLVGRTQAGKTTLCQKINNEKLQYHKTQTITIINNNMIDTPGEYLERTRMRGSLMVTSADADIIILVQDATEDGTLFPPGFGTMFAKPIVGIVTKIDIASEIEIENAIEHLKDAGAHDIYKVSSYTGAGVKELVKALSFKIDKK